MAASTADYQLFTPLTLTEGLTLKNRVVNGPTGRARCDIETRAPLERNAVYYEQRAGAGLIISGACAVSAQGFGWLGTPGLYTDEQQEGWRRVVERVHAKGGKIFLQLWHMGRQSHSSFHPVTHEVVSCSATKVEGMTTRDIHGERQDFEVARALTLEEVPEIIETYRSSAVRAKAAGFDGVELHGGNGYLVDQFLQSCTNLRTDAYGGSFENRYRFLHEIVEALKTVYPAGRIGVRLSPNGAFAGMGSADNAEMFTYAIQRLAEHSLSYLAILDGVGFGVSDKSRPLTAFDAKLAFAGGVVMANSSYARDTAEGAIRSGAADLVGFARSYMSNPDLAERFQHDWPLNPLLERLYLWSAHTGDEGYNVFERYQPEKEAK